ncbi:MAG TPA: serine hydrolase [Gemmatimonadaceae bacterium]|nr:serine hydrolase [Gemmatimonadaceae bacterium]
MFIPVVATALLASVSDGLPAKAPETVGMSAARLEAIDRVVQRGISEGGYPGAAVVVGRNGAAVLQRGFGRTGWTYNTPRVTADKTIYDLASLTKVVATTSAIMFLYDEGKVRLDDPVVKYLPEFGASGGKDRVTIRHLLTHRSGLPAGRNLWRDAFGAERARQLVLETPIYCSPGACYEYSDLGADVLGFVAERVSGQRLDQFLQTRLFDPLGMNDTYFKPADSLRYRIAPTDMNTARGYAQAGEVHDENAYALGGIAGHAGLFSTAADLSLFAQLLLNEGSYNGVRIFGDTTVRLFTTRAAGGRALGWDSAYEEGAAGAGQYMSARSFGHTGFTGTSMWIDPDRQMFVILLTNRVHAPRAFRPARVIADVRNDLADAAAAAVMDMPSLALAMPVRFRSDRATGWNDRPARRKSALRSSRSRAAAKARAAKAAKAKAAKARKSGTKPAPKPRTSTTTSRAKAKA